MIVRVALDASYSVDPYPSGIAVYSREILHGLAKAYDQDFFVHCYRPKQLRSAPPASYPNTGRWLLLPPFRTFQADVFHALNQRVDARPARAVVATFHDLFVMTGEYSTPEFRNRFRRQALAAAKRSDWVIAVSEFTARQVRDLLGFDSNRIRVISHGVRMPPITPARNRENIILFVGALQVRKNILRLIDAFERLSGGWRLILAGAPHGFGAQAIEQRIAESPRRESIEVLGYVTTEELTGLYARASIFAFPSLDEGFGIPVLEAMAHGLPVVTSKTSALPEVAGGAAILVDPQQTDEIASALSQLMNDPALRQRFGSKGLAHASRFTWQDAVDKTFSVYQNALAECR